MSKPKRFQVQPYISNGGNRKKSAVNILTPKQYAKWKGCSHQYIHKLLSKGKYGKLEGVVRVNKYSRFYTIEVSF